ncbi:MAG: hypothetical protein IPM16_18695 [Chloroflexi bacterium]|nr:hypothetical protein [Chloroflexota bacterium]
MPRWSNTPRSMTPPTSRSTASATRFARLWTLSQSLRQTGLYRTLRKLLR